jgi:hypothetical protein
MEGNVGPVPGEDPLAPGVDLNLPGDRHPGALEAKVEPPDATAQ